MRILISMMRNLTRSFFGLNATWKNILWGTFLIIFFTVGARAQSVEYNSGSGRFTLPHKINSVKVEAWGGGGSGGVKTIGSDDNKESRGGGGGGAYATNTFTGTNLGGLKLDWKVGQGGKIALNTPEPGARGGSSMYNFNSTGLVVARGGV